MKHKKGRPNSDTVRMWTLEEVQAAVPYLCSVARSLREHYLTILAKDREVQLFRRRPGRPDREALIEEQEAHRGLEKAGQDCQDVLEELSELDVLPLDPVQGTALAPFLHDGQPAWYVFDLFDSQPIRSWRYQADPDETRRALAAPPVS